MSKPNKTVENDQDVQHFLNAIENEKRRLDSFKMLKIMTEITGQKPKMWGSSIIGFGKYDYRYKSGREGSFMKVGFSPRKSNLTLYIMPGFEKIDDFLQRLGKHKIGKSCLYINRLEDVDESVLKEIVSNAYKYMTDKYG